MTSTMVALIIQNKLGLPLVTMAPVFDHGRALPGSFAISDDKGGNNSGNSLGTARYCSSRIGIPRVGSIPPAPPETTMRLLSRPLFLTSTEVGWRPSMSIEFRRQKW